MSEENNIEYVEIEFNDIIKEINYHLFRAGYSREKAQKHLILQYHKKSRMRLTDEELLEFLEWTRSLKSNYFLAFRKLIFPNFPDFDTKRPLF